MSTAGLTGLKLPFQFDPALLKRDLALIASGDWPRHYNEGDFGGNWSGIALRSANGDASNLNAAPPGNPGFRDTPLLDRCPYFRQVLSAFHCPLKAVRLLSLAPRSFIREHSDNALSYDDGEIRIHIPIETNPDVEFYVAGDRLLLEEGHSYFVNVNLPHRVNNRGVSDRVHLVIDAEVNEWVHALFRQGIAENRDIPRCARPPRNVDDFRRRVLADPALQQTLQAIEDRAQFNIAATDLGNALGFELHEGDLDAAMRGDPLPAAGDDPPIAAGWTPVRVGFGDGPEGAPSAEWIWTGHRRFSEPFFEDTVRAALRHPFARLFRREIPLAAAPESLAPTGFIFHVSRCGSTLISRMLAACAFHRVLSEAPPLDDVLQAHRRVPGLAREKQVLWLRQIVYALGAGHAAEENRLFIKLDAWHIHSLPLIREAFPDTPWIFVCRDPIEVMASQLARPGKITLPGATDPDVFGLLPEHITSLSREQWCARALAGFYRAGAAARHAPGGLFVDYRDLPEAVFGPIAGHFGVVPHESDLARMREVAGFDAKTPGLYFEPDSDHKKTHATPVVRELCELLLNHEYRAFGACSIEMG